MFSVNWSHIFQAYHRELSCQEWTVPKLSHEAMHRDSWSKMDVGLAKVFVHGELSSELRAHMITSGNFEAEKTIEYLQKLESVFSEIFLNPKRRIYGMDDLAFEQIAVADDFLMKWRQCATHV
eukprot:Pompholyxophrys_punicea_v1_NODE_269_length_2443_cov_3.185930.p3 type:complete len:123 gc:universal NODE_269_length_2443_cov_3.185930:586-218(-)